MTVHTRKCCCRFAINKEGKFLWDFFSVVVKGSAELAMSSWASCSLISKGTLEKTAGCAYEITSLKKKKTCLTEDVA